METSIKEQFQAELSKGKETIKVCVYEDAMGANGPVVYACRAKSYEEFEQFVKEAYDGKHVDQITFNGFDSPRDYEIDFDGKKIVDAYGEDTLAEFDIAVRGEGE